MTNIDVPSCPECDPVEQSTVSRRAFLRGVGAAGVSLWAAPAFGQTPGAPAAIAPAAAAKPMRPAEELVRELHAGLTDEQKRAVMYPWNHGATAMAPPTRHRIFNAAQGRRIGQVYTPPQQELIGRILRSMSADDAGYGRINTVLRSDTDGGLAGGGADIFGDPTGARPFAWVFTAHHLTLRCDGNSEPNTAFGGPLYYGHSLSGNNPRNAFQFQTQAVRGVYDALSVEQRRQARVVGRPGEGRPSIEFRAPGQARPGLAMADLSADVRRLIERTMRDILAPYRPDDANEVMDILRRNGGLERIHFAYYQDQEDEPDRWHFWRIEGPGFVWNYRVLPHVHTYVNIVGQA